MSGVSNGQNADQTNFNNAFMKENGDTGTIGVMQLNEPSAASGTAISNVQRDHNAVWSFLGGLVNQVKTYLPTWTNNNGYASANDSVYTRINATSLKFDSAAGHKHTGAAGDAPAIDSSALAGVPLRGYVRGATNLVSPSGSSTIVTTQMSGKTNSSGSSVKGVVTTAPYNRCALFQASGLSQNDYLVDSLGNEVYGRITWAASVWTLSYYVDLSGTETAYTLSAAQTTAGVKWYYQELLNPIVDAPTYDDTFFVQSDAATADVVDATSTQRGLISTIAQSLQGAKTWLALATFEVGMLIKEISTPTTPAANYKAWYAKTDGVYYLDSSGNETKVATDNYQTTVSSASLLTMTVNSAVAQFITGTLDQSVKMPVASTLRTGWSQYIQNDSTGFATVYTSDGSSNILTMQPKSACIITCILASGTTPASWTYQYTRPLESYAAVTTAGTTTTLTFVSARIQKFTGTSNQIVSMPSTTPNYFSLNFKGDSFYIVNQSTGVLTVNSSSGSLIKTIQSGESYTFTVVNTGGSGVLDWGVNGPGEILIGKDFQGGTASNTSRLTLPKAASSTLAALTRKQATLWHDTTLNKPVYDDGTNLVTIGTGSGGAVNLLDGGDGESGTTGWTLDNVAAAARPAGNLLGGPLGLTISTTATAPLMGLNSLTLAKDAVNRQGQLVYKNFLVSLGYRAKVLSVRVPYILNTANFVAGATGVDSDFIVYIREYNGSVYKWTEPSSFKFLSNSQTLSDELRAEFQTSSDTISADFVIYQASTSALAYTIKLDSISISPSTYTYGTPITDWTDLGTTTYSTPGTKTSTGILDGSWVTNVSYTGKRRRVGDTSEYDILLLCSGAPTATTLTVSIGETIDTTKLSLANGNMFELGIASILDSGVANYTGVVGFNSTTSVSILCINATGTYTAPNGINATAPFTFGASDDVHAKFSVPILGKSSSVQMSDQTDTRVVVCYGGTQTPTGTIGAAFNVAKFASIGKDTHNAYNTTTGLFTAPVSGFYQVIGNLELSHASVAVGNTTAVGVAVNGSVIHNAYKVYSATTPTNNSVSISGIVFLNAGDTTGVYSWDNGTTPSYSASFSGSNFSIQRISGPSAIAATETIAARAMTSSARTTNSTWPTVIFETANFDTHGMINLSTGAITLPISGIYEISTMLGFAGAATIVGNACIPALYIGASLYSYLGEERADTTATIKRPAAGTTLYKGIAGEVLTIRAYSDTATVLSGVSPENWVTIRRVGN